jgi:hypothetical protein
MPKLPPLNPASKRPEDYPLSEDYLAYREEQSKPSSTLKRVPYHQWIAEQLDLPEFPTGTTSVS